MPRLVLAVPMFFLAAALQAQADSSQAGPADSVRAVVEGRVVDPAGNPLAQAEIIWQSDRRSVLSRADGGFNLVVPFRGETVILVRRPGYRLRRWPSCRWSWAPACWWSYSFCRRAHGVRSSSARMVSCASSAFHSLRRPC